MVDDDSEDNYFHQIVINEMNITERIEVALNGIEALNFLKDENQVRPDIIFLDINMPKMNGWEFLEAYKDLEDDQKARVLVVMLTTSINPMDRERAEKYRDIVGFNCKPLSEKMIVEVLEQNFPDYID